MQKMQREIDRLVEEQGKPDEELTKQLQQYKDANLRRCHSIDPCLELQINIDTKVDQILSRALSIIYNRGESKCVRVNAKTQNF